jgi:hypothetical protein
MRSFMALAIGAVAVSAATITVSPARAEEVLVICAQEGQTCYLPNATTVVSYGKNGAIKSISGVTQIGCDNGSFGGDPLVGVGKFCIYKVDPPTWQWTKCAEEGTRCDFTGAKLVRYGQSNNWVYSSFVNGVDCNNGVFGDPDYGQHKQCQVANH